MGITTGQWRASIGSWQARFKFRLIGTDTNGISSSSATFYALVLAVLLVIGGVEVNPGPNTQSCCELCGVNLAMMKERQLALQQREAACDAREQAIKQRGAAVGRRGKLVARKERSSRTPAVDQEPGGVDVVRSLLEKEMVSKKGLLEWAVLNNYLSIARFLIREAKVDVEAKDSSGRSALFLAVERGVLAAVELLLPLSSEDVVNNTGKLAFHLAVRNGHTDVVKCLISDNQCLANKRNKNGWTALHIAAEKGHLDIIKFLVQESHSDVEMKLKDDWTALHLATWYGHLGIVKFLIQEAHSDVEVKNILGKSALHIAAQCGHLHIIKFLLQEARADVEAKCNTGATALHFAAYASHLPVAVFLVRWAQADVGSKNEDGRTALQLSRTPEMKNFLRQNS